MIGGGWVVGGLLYGKKVLEGKSVCCWEHSSDVIKPFKAITLITSLAYLPLLRGFNYQQPVYSPCLSLEKGFSPLPLLNYMLECTVIQGEISIYSAPGF